MFIPSIAQQFQPCNSLSIVNLHVPGLTHMIDENENSLTHDKQLN